MFPTHPIIFEIGSFKLHSYGVMVFLAFAAGVWLGAKRAKNVGIAPAVVMDLSVWLVVAGLAGARLTYVIAHIDEFSGRWIDVISPIQSDGSIGIAGLVVLGGVAAGLPTAWLFLRKRDIPFLKMTDILAPSLAMGMALGRVGCYANGCCFGLPTASWLGVTFPQDSFAGYVFPGLSIHPTQIYSLLYNLAIMGVLLWRTPRKRFEGELFYLFLVLYGAARFSVEMLRYYDPAIVPLHIRGVGITGSMVASLAMAVIGLAMILKSSRRREAKGGA